MRLKLEEVGLGVVLDAPTSEVGRLARYCLVLGLSPVGTAARLAREYGMPVRALHLAVLGAHSALVN